MAEPSNRPGPELSARQIADVAMAALNAGDNVALMVPIDPRHTVGEIETLVRSLSTITDNGAIGLAISPRVPTPDKDPQ